MILLTEEDARKKICPRSIAAMPGAPDQDNYVRNCRGSECMAWRDADTQRGTRGWCGLGGMPPEIARPLIMQSVELVLATDDDGTRARGRVIIPS